MSVVVLDRRSYTWEDARKELDWQPGGGINIAHEAVRRHALSDHHDHVAIRCIRQDRSFVSLTYAELNAKASRFAFVLRRLGIRDGHTVAVLLGRTSELYIAALGTWMRTAMFCPLYAAFGPEPIRQRLVRGDVQVLLTTTSMFERKVWHMMSALPALQKVLLTDAPSHMAPNVLSLPLLMAEADADHVIPRTDPQTPASLHFTSGTTGLPKGAVHVHKAVLTHVATARSVLELRDDDVFWCTADPGWVTGTSYGIIAPLVCGVTMVVDEAEFDASRWYSILEEHRVTVWYTAPTAVRRLMRLHSKPRETFDLSALRSVHSVGEPLSADAVRWGTEMLGMPVLDNWWQTETGGIMIANTPSMNVKPGSMGLPIPGVIAAIAEVTNTEARIIETPNVQGQLVLHRDVPSLCTTYLHEDERYKRLFRGTWYITGDIAKRDSDGYFWYVGRGDDIIKTSGHMVGPFEVERVLVEHRAVVEAAVIGMPDPVVGEFVRAYVVLADGVDDSETIRQDILAEARRLLGPAVAPKEILVIDTIPKTRSGKVMRRLLKARAQGLPEGDTSTIEQG